MSEHRPGCPRSQFWDAGEFEAPCTCDTKPPLASADEGARRRRAAVTKVEYALRTRTSLIGPFDHPPDEWHDDGFTYLVAVVPVEMPLKRKARR